MTVGKPIGQFTPSETMTEDFNQTAHGLVVENVIRFAAGAWIKAQADTNDNSEALGIVSAVADVDNFTITYSGRITGLSGLTADTVFFLSDITAGLLQIAEPAISKPMLFATSTTEGDVYAYRTVDDSGGGGGGGNQLASFSVNDSMYPASNPAGAFSRNEHAVINFDDTTPENIVLPKVISEDYSAGNIIIDIDWMGRTATSGGVTWGVQIERLNAGGTDIDTDSFAAQQTGTTTTNATSGIVNRTSIVLTQAEADGIEAGDSFRLAIQRVTGDGGDDMVGDAQILNVNMRQ